MDRRRRLGHLTNQRVRDSAGVEAPGVLRAWVARASTTDERAERRAQARGLVHEAFHLGAGAALADGHVNEQATMFLAGLASEIDVSDAVGESIWNATASGQRYKNPAASAKDVITPLSLADVEARGALVGEPGRTVLRVTAARVSGSKTIYAAGACGPAPADTYYLVTDAGLHYAETGRDGVSPQFLAARSVGVLRAIPNGGETLFAFCGDESAESLLLARVVIHPSGETVQRLAVVMGSVLDARIFVARE